MFSKILNSEKGKVFKGTIICCLVFTLTFANILFLVPYILESHAVEVDLQNEKTNNENVSFKAVFKEQDEEGMEKELSSVSKNTEEQANLHLSISPKNGYLTDIKIDFQNSNFVYAENGEQVLTLKQVNQGEVANFSIPLKIKKSNEFQIDLLNMVSDIVFTAKYAAGKEITDVSATKQVNINWTQNQEIAAQITQNLITNKIYEIDEVQRRIIQVEVESKLANSEYPIKNTQISVEAPKIEGAEIEDVVIASKDALATNGKQISEDDYSYNNNTNLVNINLENTANEEGKLSWVGGEDKLIITYVYNNESVIQNINTKAISNITLQNDINLIAPENILSIENISEGLGNIINYETTANNQIHKGYMYTGNETEYTITNDVFVSYANGTNKIQIANAKGTMEGINIKDNITKTIFNKNQLLNLLGEEGIVTIYDAENPSNIINNINIAEEKGKEGQDILLEYAQEIGSVVIETSAPITEGKINIINNKKLTILDNLTEEQKQSISQIKLLSNLSTTKDNIAKENTIQTLEPTTNFEISTNNNNITAVEENSLRLTTVLKTNSAECKLFSNPTVEIELPNEIEEVKIDNISLLFEQELSILNNEIITKENGNKAIKIQLTGEQTKYNNVELQEGPTIVLDLKVNTKKIVSNKNVQIKTTCINNEEKIEKATSIQILNKIGILNQTSISIEEKANTVINENNIEATINAEETATINNKFINNYCANFEKLIIIGELPADNQGKIISAVETDIPNAVVYYTTDLEKWVTEVENYEGIKAFKIETQETISQGQEINMTTILKGKGETKLKITGIANEQNIEKVYSVKLNQITSAPVHELPFESGANPIGNYAIEVTAGGEQISENENIFKGQTLRYKVKIMNTTQTSMTNLKMEASVENGVFYTLVPCGVVTDIYSNNSEESETDDEESEGIVVYCYDEDDTKKVENIEVAELKPGEVATLEYQIVANGKTENELVNNIVISANEFEDINLKDAKTIVDANLGVKLKYGYTENNEVYSNSNVDMIIETKNLTEEELNNVSVTVKIPDGLTCNEKEQLYIEYNENCSIKVIEDKAIITFDKVPANEVESVKVTFFAKQMDYSKPNQKVQLTATATVAGDNNTYVSNDYSLNILQNSSFVTASFASDFKGEQLSENDELTYTVTVQNGGSVDLYDVSIEDYIQSELKVVEAKIIYSNGEEKNIEILENASLLEVKENIKAQDYLTIKIKVKVDLTNSEAKEISNKIIITGQQIETVETEEVKYIVNKPEIIEPIEPTDDNDPVDEGDTEDYRDIEESGGLEDPESEQRSEEPEEPTDPENPEDPIDPEKPEDPTDPEEPAEEKYSISGLAWLDENEDGIMDNSEEILKGIKVYLFNNEGNYVLDEDNKPIYTLTLLNGTYKFNNLYKGEYMVAFEYDVEKYSVTKYQKPEADETKNSDAISKTVKINGEEKLIAITDTIIVTDTVITDINLGLVNATRFDLSLEKYISKLIVTNQGGAVTYTYQNTNFAKTEVKAKYLKNTSLIIEYEIRIANEGNIEGNVTNIIDYIPEGLTFNSELNEEWFQATDGTLHNISLTEEPIPIGETRAVKLILTKTLKADETGTIRNVAEIGAATNIKQIQDIDSTAGNKNNEEDDIGEAILLIAIATGSPVFYIGVVIGCLIVLRRRNIYYKQKSIKKWKRGVDNEKKDSNNYFNNRIYIFINLFLQ